MPSSVNEIDRFWREEEKILKLNSRAATKEAARLLEAEVKRQIKTSFSNPSKAFINGVKVYDFDNSSIVRLSPILSAHAEAKTIKSDKYLWILLPDGARNGFRRISPGFNWTTIKRRYGTRLSIVAVDNGHVVLFRQSSGQIVPIYKLQPSVNQSQKIEFYEAATKIADRYGL